MDRDLRRIVAGGIFLIGLNTACAVLALRRRDFVGAFTSLVWTFSCVLLLLHTRSLQETRDQIRVALSLANRVEEEQEHD
jgi:hypothetical protein